MEMTAEILAQKYPGKGSVMVFDAAEKTRLGGDVEGSFAWGELTVRFR